MLPDGAEKVRFATCCRTPVATQNSSRHVCLSPSHQHVTLLAAAKLGLKVYDVDTALSAVSDMRQVRRPGTCAMASHPFLIPRLCVLSTFVVALHCFAFRCSLTHGRRYVSRDGRGTDPMGSKRHPRRRRHLLTSPSRHRPNPPAPPGHLLRAHDRDEGQPQAPAQGALRALSNRYLGPYRIPT